MLIAFAGKFGGAAIRPGQGTHLFEITVLGIHARGDDLADAARNWIAVARNLYPEAAQDRGATEAGLTRASAILSRPREFTEAQLRVACRAVVLCGRADWLLLGRASALLRQLDREAAERIAEGARA
ncbi:hypothetical protein [Rhodobacter sp. KR11]|uniref:hypothetical protein n=1 Tax=Rhodobacter sp. KR11 TaxID=2974588 RepID=UPI002222A63B|nr:hypothetical protein [Rhodobacter sp. KR11]